MSTEELNDLTASEQDDEAVLQTTGREARRGGFSWGNAPMPTEKSRDLRTSLRRLASILGKEIPVLIVVGVFALVSVTLMVLGPRLLGNATDIIVVGVRTGTFDTAKLHDKLVTLVIMYAIAFVFGYAQTYLTTGALQRSMYRLRESVEAKLHRLPLSYVDTHARGDLLSRVTNDIDNLAQGLQQTFSQTVTSLLMIVGVTIMMVTISPLLTIVALVTVPISLLLAKVITKRARPKFISQWRSTGNINAQAEEAFSAHALVTAFGRRGDVQERFETENTQLYDASRSAQFTASLTQPIMGLLSNLQYVSIAVVGGLRIASRALSLGDMQAMLQYIRQFGMPLQQLAAMSATLQSGLASLERVVELLDADEQSADPQATHVQATQGRIVFENVDFSYSPERRLITGLNLVAEPGQTIAIVGPTGAGKTTLVNLLLRFYDLDRGTITLDGQDIAAIPRRELRSKFGMVLQDTWLFGGTIRDNLRYGNPSATDEQILQAAKVTYVDRFVHSLPDGYDTVLNEEGDNVSAGQKQLLTIARAFLADPAILILDEATSSVDTRTEVLIQEAMNALRAHRTSFVIAHRLSTIRRADVILVMDGGRIVEQGNHDDLIVREGPYAALYAAQFDGQAT